MKMIKKIENNLDSSKLKQGIIDGENNLKAFIDGIKLMMEEIIYEAKELEGHVALIKTV